MEGGVENDARDKQSDEDQIQFFDEGLSQQNNSPFDGWSVVKDRKNVFRSRISFFHCFYKDCLAKTMARYQTYETIEK